MKISFRFSVSVYSLFTHIPVFIRFDEYLNVLKLGWIASDAFCAFANQLDRCRKLFTILCTLHTAHHGTVSWRIFCMTDQCYVPIHCIHNESATRAKRCRFPWVCQVYAIEKMKLKRNHDCNLFEWNTCLGVPGSGFLRFHRFRIQNRMQNRNEK